MFRRQLTCVPLALVLYAAAFGCSSGASEESLSEEEVAARKTIKVYSTDLNGPSLPNMWIRFDEVYRDEKVAVLSDPAGRVLLRTRSAAVLDTQLRAMEKFRSLREPAFTLTPAIAATFDRKAVGGWFEARIDVLLGPDVHRVLWKSLGDTADANCFDLAMWGRGIVNEIRFASPSEMNYMWRSPQCRALAPGEAQLTGDLVAVRSGNDRNDMDEAREVHAALVISDDLWLSKNGGAPITIGAPAVVLGNYLAGQSTKCADHSNSSIARCSGHVTYFRCEGTEEYRARMPKDAWTTTIRDLHADLEPLLYAKEQANWIDTYGEDGEASIAESYVHKEVYRWSTELLARSKTPFSAEQVANVRSYLARLPPQALPIPFTYEPPAYPKTLETPLVKLAPQCLEQQRSVERVECVRNEAGGAASALYREYVRSRITKLTKLARDTEVDLRNANGARGDVLKARLHLLYSLYHRVRSIDTVHTWFDSELPELSLPR
jgi:hypothetical protein